MAERTALRFCRVLPWLVGLALAAFAAAWLSVAVSRLLYPFDVDFLEDDILVEAWRIAHGLPIFLAPNASFVPHAYAPLYMLLSAPLLALTGPSFLPMRLLSFAATLATAGMLAWAAFQVRRRLALALLAPGIFIAGYALTGAQFELARVDALFIALTLSGTLAGIVGSHARRGRLLAALLLAMAFFAKQTALVFAAGMGAWLLWEERARAADFIVAYLAALALPLAALDRLTGGWSSYYLFVVPQSDPLELARIADYVRHDLLQELGPLFALLVVMHVLRLRGLPARSALARAWPWYALLAILASGWMRARTGGNLNSLLPAYTFLSLVPALLYIDLSPTLNPSERPGPTAESPSLAHSEPNLATTLLCLALLWQLVLCVYNSSSQMPRSAMADSGRRLVERIRESPGPVLVLEHPAYALLAGKPEGVALTALWHARLHGALPIPPDLVQRVRDHYYLLVISDDGEVPEVSAAVDSLLTTSYQLQPAQPTADGPPTLSGLVVRPHFFYVPRP